MAGQNLHMEAKETEELLDWIAAEAGLEEVSFNLPAIKKCCKKFCSNRKLMYALFGMTQVFFAVEFAFNFTYDQNSFNGDLDKNKPRIHFDDSRI